MQARRTFTPGQKGAKKFLEHYGGQLVYARYSYDEQRHSLRIWLVSTREPEIVELRVEFEETELQRRVKLASGKLNSAKRVWGIHYDRAEEPSAPT